MTMQAETYVEFTRRHGQYPGGSRAWLNPRQAENLAAQGVCRVVSKMVGAAPRNKAVQAAERNK